MPRPPYPERADDSRGESKAEEQEVARRTTALKDSSACLESTTQEFSSSTALESWQGLLSIRYSARKRSQNSLKQLHLASNHAKAATDRGVQMVCGKKRFTKIYRDVSRCSTLWSLGFFWAWGFILGKPANLRGVEDVLRSQVGHWQIDPIIQNAVSLRGPLLECGECG